MRVQEGRRPTAGYGGSGTGASVAFTQRTGAAAAPGQGAPAAEWSVLGVCGETPVLG